ncbi:MAG: hypothetical protein GEU83_07530 [Pseudonocardiaceae bacterium]|nr:hypothetical protein [Pseudonocardiaceae bacterium]
MNQLQTETRGRFRWLKTVECDDDAGVTFRTARAQLPTGLFVERVNTCEGDGTVAAMVFVTDLAGCEVTLSTEQSAELRAALGELPAPDQSDSDPVHFGSPQSPGQAWKPQRSVAVP